MVNDFRPHLLIPETEIEHVEHKPTGRSKERDVDRFEHGQKLSTGLQEIISAYTKIQSGDSLSDEDIRIFEVVLPEGHKLSNKSLRDFLQQEGLTITSVRDERHATVSSTRSKFEGLQGRVGNYRDNKKSNKQFQYIDEFRFIDPMDKQARTLRELFDEWVESVGKENMMLDVEMRLISKLRDLSEESQEKVKATLIQKIEAHQGYTKAKPYTLSDGVSVIRAEIPIESLKEISNDTVVSHVTPTAFFTTAPAHTVDAQRTVQLDKSVNLEELPVVVILDDGVDFPAELEPVIMQHWKPAGTSGGNANHGTSVASKAVFANVGEQLGRGVMRPRVRIIDANVRGADPECDKAGHISNSTMITRIKEAVLTFKDVAKIFNFSSASTEPIQGDEISLLGYELDVLHLTYGVEFVIAAGNHELYRTQSSLEEIIDDDDARIAQPADSMLNIAVGAIVGQDHKDSLSQSHDVAPYSRIGPGFLGLRKPDMVAYAGTLLSTGFAPPDSYSHMLGAGGKWAFVAGTSFTAPVVAGDLAEISTTVPDGNILMSKALLYHGADMPIQKKGREKITRDDAAFYGDLYGRGISSPSVSMFSNAHRVTFLHSSTLNKLDKQRVKFLMPKIFENKMDMSKRDQKIRVGITCVTQSPVDNEKGADYLGAYVMASLYQINGNGKKTAGNPSDADGRTKWDTCYHFDRTFSSFRGGDWEVWLQLHTRYDVEDLQEIEYALAITIEDLTQSFDIYNEILLEAQGRFPAVNLVRISVRQ